MVLCVINVQHSIGIVEGWLDQLQWQCSVVIRWMDRCSAGGAKQLHSIQLSRYLRHIYNIYKDH